MINNKFSLLSLCIIAATSASNNSYADIYDGTPQKFIAKHSGKCMDVRLPRTESSYVAQMPCSSDCFQKWKTVALPNNEFQIISAASGMCLDVSGASQVNGALIKQSACVKDRPNQTWYINQVSSGTYQITSKNSGKCLDVYGVSTADDAPLQQWDCNTKANQLWSTESEKLTPSPPITINGKTNVTISNVKITNPAGPCILIKGNSRFITIKNSDLGPCKTDHLHPQPNLTNVGAGVFVTESGDVTVDNVKVHDTEDSGITIFYGSNYIVTNNQINNTNSHAIKVQAASNALIQSNQLNTVNSGIYVANTTNVKVLKNNLAHMQGRPRANFIQFNQVTGSGNRIMCNIGQQDAYGTPNSLDSIEDDISLYLSTGTATDPLLVVGNKIKNGGPSQTGGGIMLGDNGGSDIIARDNVVVNTGGYGVAISGGKNMKILNNKIFSTYFPITHNAIPVWNYSSFCDNVTVSGNRVNWTTAWGPETKIWTNGTCSNPHFGTNTFQDTSITAAIFDTYKSPECD